MNSEDQNPRLVKRYTRLAIVSAFLLALLWPLGGFFFWIFAGAAFSFGFLAFYYSPRTNRANTNFSYDRSSQQQRSAGSQDINTKKKVKLSVAIIFIVSFAILFILLIIGLVTGGESTQATEEISFDESRGVLIDDPDNLDALTNLGNSFYANRQYDSALVYYNRVLKIDSKNSSGLYNKGLVYYVKEDYKKSMELLRQCISLYPDNTDAIMVMGDNNVAQENFNEAITWYKQAYDKGVRKSGLLNMMAYVYDVQNQQALALRFYKETLEQDSSLVRVYDRLAELEPGKAEWYRKKAEAWR